MDIDRVTVSVDTRVMVDVPEAARRLMLPERAVWTEIAAGRLRSFKVGKHRRVAVSELQAFVDRQDRPVRAAKTSAAPGAAAVAPSPGGARKPAPARRQTVPDDGVKLPFVILPDGSVTTRSIQRREAREAAQRQNPRKKSASGR